MGFHAESAHGRMWNSERLGESEGWGQDPRLWTEAYPCYNHIALVTQSPCRVPPFRGFALRSKFLICRIWGTHSNHSKGFMLAGIRFRLAFTADPWINWTHEIDTTLLLSHCSSSSACLWSERSYANIILRTEINGLWCLRFTHPSVSSSSYSHHVELA